MDGKSDYASKYKEMDIIGRGNFGSATLVQAADGKLYVAKKILMNYLSAKEKEFSLSEANMMKDLKHANIVQYIESFIEKDVLIIIMEYCEEGDLGFHVKRRQQKKELIPEKIILNWFLQIALALDYIHSKKILHRDIKSSNIFLTSNGTVKIGDFGISKVLEGTQEAANTVVGTPYYMSPEVCENKPYTYKSDVWALGCVLYELCTLKHAFAADNLLGLVYKIVKDQYDPVPGIYSRELSNLIQKLLNKNEKERPTIREILRDPFMVGIMSEFVATKGGATTEMAIPIKKTAVHKEMIKKSQEELPDYSNETPAQRIKRKKEEEAARQLEQMKRAARDNLSSLAQAKQRKLDELQGSSPGMKNDAMKKKALGGTMHHTGAGGGPMIQPQHVPQLQQPGGVHFSGFDNNSSVLKSTIKSKFEETNFGEGTVLSMNTSGVTENSIYMKTNQMDAFHDTRAITGTGRGQNTTTNNRGAPVEEYKRGGDPGEGTVIQEDIDEYEEYYSDDFETDDDDPNSRLTKKAGEKEMKDVLEVYKKALTNDYDLPTPTLRDEPMANSTVIKEAQHRKDDIIEKKRQECVKRFGQPMFEKLYNLLKHHRNLGTSDIKVREELGRFVDKKEMNACLAIDEIIFLEMMNK